jgi:hypothetical protein
MDSCSAALRRGCYRQGCLRQTVITLSHTAAPRERNSGRNRTETALGEPERGEVRGIVSPQASSISGGPFYGCR